MTTVRWWWEFEEYKEAVVMDIEYNRAGGSGPPDFGEFLQSGGSSNPNVWHGDLGDVPSDWEDPGKILPQSGSPSRKNIPKMTRAGS